jgi:hypothetical protein
MVLFLLGAGLSDDLTAFGDPVLAASLGWRNRDGDQLAPRRISSSANLTHRDQTVRL